MADKELTGGKTQWTPGPWESADADGWVREAQGERRWIGWTCEILGNFGVQQRANNQLFAAAPELYDFIATLENDNGAIPEWLWEKRNALLAKARGEQ